MKIVPRFFPFLVTTLVTPAFDSVEAGGEPETLNPSSTGTELLTPRLAAGVLYAGMLTEPAGA